MTRESARRRARETAQRILGQLDNPAATLAARRRLRKVLTDIGYTGQLDAEQLERAVFDVFEPGTQQIRGALGHLAAPVMAEPMVKVTKARLTAVTALKEGDVTDDEFYQARHAHLMAYTEYALKQPTFVGGTPPQHPDMYEPVTAERALNDCCTHLLTAIGLGIIYPDRAAQIGQPRARAACGTSQRTPHKQS